MSFLDQELSNDVFISVRGRLQQKLVTRLTRTTVGTQGARQNDVLASISHDNDRV